MNEIIEKGYKNAGYFFIPLFAIVIFGFFKTYFGLFPHFNEHTTTIVHFHAFVLLLWIILLIIQPLLIRYKKLSAHRFFGRFTYVLVPLIIFSFIAMMNKQIGEEQAQKMTMWPIIKSLYMPFTDTLLFSTFYILAIKYKRKVALHARYMIVTGLVFIDASLIRSLGIWFHVDFFYAALVSIAFVDLILIILIYNDKLKGRNFKPFLISLTLFLVIQTGIVILNYH
jgi:hypothetical protein